MNDTYETNPVAQPVFLIAEDHDNLRKSLCGLIKTVFRECSLLEARDGNEALTQALNWQPDIVLMDISMPVMNGIEATRHIKAALPKTPVVILTIHENPEYQTESFAAGASAYILKRKIGTELIPNMVDLLSSFTGVAPEV